MSTWVPKWVPILDCLSLQAWRTCQASCAQLDHEPERSWRRGTCSCQTLSAQSSSRLWGVKCRRTWYPQAFAWILPFDHGLPPNHINACVVPTIQGGHCPWPAWACSNWGRAIQRMCSGHHMYGFMSFHFIIFHLLYYFNSFHIALKIISIKVHQLWDSLEHISRFWVVKAWRKPGAFEWQNPGSPCLAASILGQWRKRPSGGTLPYSHSILSEV